MTAVVAPRLAGGEVGLWAGSAVLALAAHAAVAAWMLRQPPTLAADPSPPAAVMLELAPVPAAPEATETTLAPDVVDQEQILEAPDLTPLPPDPMAEAAPPPPDPPPPPDIAPPLEDVLPPVDMTPVEMAAVAVERPLRRPEDLPKPPEPEVKEVSRTPPPEKEPPQERKTRAEAVAPPAPKAAAPQDSRGGASSAARDTWRSRLMARLERAKRYPAGARKRGEEGVVHVRFSIDGEGRVLSVALDRSSGFAELDAEVLALVKRASPLPVPPAGMAGTISAPVKFNIR